MLAMIDELRTTLNKYLEQGAVGANLSVSLPSRETETISVGFADRVTRKPVTADSLFKIGSCTKTFLAVSLMKLASDGLVDIEEPIARWFPDLPRAAEIMVRQLIDHRGGLPEFEHDIPMTSGRVWTPRELVDSAYSHHEASPPGGPAIYNNTGYVLAGLVIESVTGKSLGAHIRSSILEPLGLKDTYSAATEQFPETQMVHGYYLRPPSTTTGDIASGGEMWRMEGILPLSDELQDSTSLFPFSGAYACGDMVSTTADMVTFLDAVFDGRLIPPKFLAAMTDNRALVSFPGTRMRETGIGIFSSDYGGRRMFGHQGSIPGYVTVMQHDRASGLSVAMTSNVGSGNRLSFQASGLHLVVDDIVRTILDE
jgi:D-alanyl-D-alanine carboxypeptidase